MSTLVDRLRDHRALRELLAFYVSVSERHKTVEWHDRLMELAGISEAELTALHGELIAWGWLDCRIGHDSFSQPGKLSRCYKATREGAKLLRQSLDPFRFAENAESSEDEEEHDADEAA
jgi:hypothetical protein